MPNDEGSINDENVRKGIVNIFLRAIYLKDDRFTLILNGDAIDGILSQEKKEVSYPQKIEPV